MDVIVSNDGSEFKKIESVEFPLENKLQELIHENQILKKIQLGPDNDLTLITLAREFSTTSGPIDVLGIDVDGRIYIIETKLKKNTDRRDILAQVIDYAGAMWDEFKNYDEFETKIKNNTGKSLMKLIQSSGIIESDGIPDVLNNIKYNLSLGEFKFVTVWNKLEPKLINAINYLNEKSPLSIYAITFDYYRDNGIEIIIPSVFGGDAEKRSTTKGSRMKWTEETTKEEFKKNFSKEEFESFEKLELFVKQNATVIKTGTGKSASYNPVFKKFSMTKDPPRSLLTLFAHGNMQINFAWMSVKYRKIFAEKFAKIPDLEINTAKDYGIEEGYKYPRFTRDQWSKNINEIISSIREYL